MAHLHKLSIRGHVIEFRMFIVTTDAEPRIKSLAPFFKRMPDVHLRRLYPIFIIEEKPGGRPGGGTWPPGTDFPKLVGGGARARRTHIPDADLQDLIITPHRGLIGIPRDRWERPIPRVPATVFHEVGHCIDHACGGLVPRRATEADFAGMNTTVCGDGNLRVRQAVEAYARTIYDPTRIFHTLPPGDTPRTANLRLLNALRRSPAFAGVPSSWPPPGHA